MKTFDEDLERLARKIGEMGRRVQKQIADAVDALAGGDVRVAQMVLTADDAIDAIQHEIEEKAVLTIARRQPLVIDLREVVGALRISNDLERVGDLAKNIAKRTLQVGGSLRPNQVTGRPHRQGTGPRL